MIDPVGLECPPYSLCSNHAANRIESANFPFDVNDPDTMALCMFEQEVKADVICYRPQHTVSSVVRISAQELWSKWHQSTKYGDEPTPLLNPTMI
jgi:hypothetical protein